MKVREFIAALQGCNQEVDVVFVSNQNNATAKYNNVTMVIEKKNVYTNNPAILGIVEVELTI
jgi:hypothetical protein